MPMRNDNAGRRKLADLYAALAKDLVDWKTRYPDKIEDPTQVNPPTDLPVVYKVHHELARALEALQQPGAPPRTAEDLARKTDAELASLHVAVNKVLTDHKDKLGGSYELRVGEVRCLVLLMLVPANEDLAPYIAPPSTKGW